MQRLFIANRGEVVSRVARSARARGLRVVGVCSRPDSEMPYLADLDEAVVLQGTTPAETYLNISALIEAATGSSCDAVHPGYGFLAENAAFARAVADADLTWVGPSAKSIDTPRSQPESRTWASVSRLTP